MAPTARRRVVKDIETLAEFVATLDSRQREFFLQRELHAEQQLQSTLLEVGRGISRVSELHGESLSIRRAEDVG